MICMKCGTLNSTSIVIVTPHTPKQSFNPELFIKKSMYLLEQISGQLEYAISQLDDMRTGYPDHVLNRCHIMAGCVYYATQAATVSCLMPIINYMTYMCTSKTVEDYTLADKLRHRCSTFRPFNNMELGFTVATGRFRGVTIKGGHVYRSF